MDRYRCLAARALLLVAVVSRDATFILERWSGNAAGTAEEAAAWIVAVCGAVLLSLPALFAVTSSALAPSKLLQLSRRAAGLSGVALILIGAVAALCATDVSTLLVGTATAGLGAWSVAAAIVPRPHGSIGVAAEGPSGRWAAVLFVLSMMTLASMPHGCTKDRAYVAAMKSDLRNLTTAEEAIFAETGRYSAQPGERFRSSSGVIGLHITLTEDGWTARAAHVSVSGECYMFYGSTPIGTAEQEGVVACRVSVSRSQGGDNLALMSLGLFLAALGVLINRPARD